MLKKIASTVLAFLCIIGSLAACKANAPKSESSEVSSKEPVSFLGDEAAFQKFDEPVQVHIGRSVSPTDKTLPQGDDAGNNQYTRYLKENFNIEVIIDWTAASGNDYNQKVSLAIAGNSLPDGMVVGDKSYMLKAAKSDMLYDISDLFTQYASSQVQDVMASTNGRAMENCSYNGKMVSLPNVSVEASGIHVMHIRKDWLDECGLEVPKTISDIEEAAQAFVDKKLAGSETIGISGPSKSSYPYATFLTPMGNMFGFDPIFQAMDAYPGYWVEGEDGKIIYGTTSENTKNALAVLADWYQKGLIDPEMGIRDTSSEPLNANQTGIYFGVWHQLGYGNGDSFRNDPNANWQSYPVYSDDGKWNVHMGSVGTWFTLISKNASEDAVKAMIIMHNVYLRDESIFDTSVSNDWYPLRNIMAAADECSYEHNELSKILKGESQVEDYNVEGSMYKLMKSDAENLRSVIPDADLSSELSVNDFNMENMGNFQRLYSLMIGARPYALNEPDKKVYSATYTQTPTMEKKWSNLKKLEDETVLKIITGKADISEFDTFVEKWHSQGGDEILAELNED